MKATTVASGSRHAFNALDEEAVPTTAPEVVTIQFFNNEVPAFVDAEMVRLYENLYSSLARFRLYDDLSNASTYVARRGGKTIALFLFRCAHREVSVLNQQITIEEEEIRRFTEAIFAAFQSVNAISFYAIQTEIRQPSFPYRRYYCLSDIVLNCPASVEEYLPSLGKSTRSNLRTRMNKLKRVFPSFCCDVYEREAVSEQHIRRIIELSGARMATKNKDAYIDAQETARIIDLARVCGFVCVATIDGQVCAGMIGFRLGTHYFMHVLAHDPQYDDYRLGTINCYLTICQAIARGAKELRFGGSTHRYKFDFLGVGTDFDNLVVYRSHVHRWLNSDRALLAAFKAYVRQARKWLLLAERRDGIAARAAARIVRGLRNLKQSGKFFWAARK